MTTYIIQPEIRMQHLVLFVLSMIRNRTMFVKHNINSCTYRRIHTMYFFAGVSGPL